MADVNKVLMAVSALVDSGHRVIFDQDEETGVDLSFIVNKKTNESIRMRMDRNVWVIDAYVENDEADEEADFARQE